METILAEDRKAETTEAEQERRYKDATAFLQWFFAAEEDYGPCAEEVEPALAAILDIMYTGNPRDDALRLRFEYGRHFIPK